MDLINLAKINHVKQDIEKNVMLPVKYNQLRAVNSTFSITNDSTNNRKINTSKAASSWGVIWYEIATDVIEFEHSDQVSKWVVLSGNDTKWVAIAISNNQQGWLQEVDTAGLHEIEPRNTNLPTCPLGTRTRVKRIGSQFFFYSQEDGEFVYKFSVDLNTYADRFTFADWNKYKFGVLTAYADWIKDVWYQDTVKLIKTGFEGKKVNALGDSITEGWRTSKTYLEFMDDIVGFSTVRNYGIAGTRIAHQTGDNDNNYARRYTLMDNDADLVIVFGGVNDFIHGTALMGVMADRTDDTFYGACHVLYSGLISKYPSSRIYILTPLQKIAHNTPNSNGYVLSDYVTAIKEVAAYYSLPVIDLFNSGIYADSSTVRTQLMEDGIHPNIVYHHTLANKIMTNLK